MRDFLHELELAFEDCWICLVFVNYRPYLRREFSNLPALAEPYQPKVVPNSSCCCKHSVIVRTDGVCPQNDLSIMHFISLEGELNTILEVDFDVTCF